jgi:beta-galactosidase
MHDHYIPFWESSVPVDVLSSERDFSSYRLVVAPLLWMLKPGVADRLRVFVENGGTLVATYYTGFCDESNLTLTGGWPGDGLMDLFGIWNEETDWMAEGTRRKVHPAAGNPLDLYGELVAREVAAIVHLRGAEALATYSDEFYAGTPALSLNRVGSGQAVYVGAQLEVESLRRLYSGLIDSLGLTRVAEAPPAVAVQRRGDYVFIQNFTPEPATVKVGDREIEVKGFTGTAVGPTA